MTNGQTELSDKEISLINTLYEVTSNQLQKQLEYVLIIRGWAITIFIFLISAVIVYKTPWIGLPGISALLLFLWIEAIYDSYRLAFAWRYREFEKQLYRPLIKTLGKRINTQCTLYKLFPTFHKNKIFPKTKRDRIRYAIFAESRFCVYLVMCSILGIINLYYYLSSL